jgi:predicted lipoprotein with Yx(FWY)xxD motif
MAVRMQNERSLQTPVEVSIMVENGQLVFRTDSATPFYVFDKDQPGKSNCEGACTYTWVPVYPNRSDAQAVGDWTLLTRKDGSKQWAYKGRPIYTNIHDEAGKPTGDGMDGVWHILKP